MTQYITTPARTSSLTVRIPLELRDSLNALRERAKRHGASIDYSRCAADAIARLIRDASRSLDALDASHQAPAQLTAAADNDEVTDVGGWRP